MCMCVCVCVCVQTDRYIKFGFEFRPIRSQFMSFKSFPSDSHETPPLTVNQKE